MGKRHYPVYKIVAADSRFPRDGRFIEAVGTYNPNLDPMQVTLKEARVKYWLGVGAKPTDTVRSILKSEGVILKMYLQKKGKTESEIETEYQKFLSQKDSKMTRAKEKKARRKASKKAKKDTKETVAETQAATNETPAE